MLSVAFLVGFGLACWLLLWGLVVEFGCCVPLVWTLSCAVTRGLLGLGIAVGRIFHDTLLVSILILCWLVFYVWVC